MGFFVVVKRGNSGCVRAMVNNRPSQKQEEKNGGQSRRENRYVIA